MCQSIAQTRAPALQAVLESKSHAPDLTRICNVHDADEQHGAMALPHSNELGPHANSPSSLPLGGDVPEHGALPLPGSGELSELSTRPHDVMQGTYHATTTQTSYISGIGVSLVLHQAS